MEKVVLKTVDEVGIAGLYYPSSSNKGVVLLHMMPATKESWGSFVERLHQKGYHVLSIDLRGHGESMGGPEGYKNFSDADHQASIRDVDAAALFLRSQGVAPDRTAFIGASIGANLALWYLADHSEATQTVALSPGLNYRGVETDPVVRRLRKGQRVFIVASEDDERQSGRPAQMSRTLYDHLPSGVEKKLLAYKLAGHGTDMFGKEQPDLADEILRWLQ